MGVACFARHTVLDLVAQPLLRSKSTYAIAVGLTPTDGTFSWRTVPK
ncbi:hypothetical protein HMPREF9511_01722 [Enterococcus faecalis TX0630]|uniref:Uncharacterized protein n=1 Tax=Enterococcus faecalis TX0630 TaxID=749508 RepID=A0ABC9P5I5_ENTFL|nr:hypothetical protein HMPREF9511_01722 [Enterococcus faecalis TX0630]